MLGVRGVLPAMLYRSSSILPSGYVKPKSPLAIGVFIGAALISVVCALVAFEGITSASFESIGRRLQKASETRSSRVLDNLTGGGGGEGDGNAMEGIIRLIVWLVWSICALIWGFFYKTKVVDLIPVLGAKAPQGPGANLKAGLCDCCFNIHLCLHVCFCGPCRLGHTLQVAGICDFWMATIFWDLCPCLECCLGPYYRQQLRAKLGLEQNCCCDFVSYLFCAPCAIGQDAIEVDAESGAQVTCCMNLIMAAAAPPVVGQAVVGQPVLGEVIQKNQTE